MRCGSPECTTTVPLPDAAAASNNWASAPRKSSAVTVSVAPTGSGREGASRVANEDPVDEIDVGFLDYIVGFRTRPPAWPPVA